MRVASDNGAASQFNQEQKARLVVNVLMKVGLEVGIVPVNQLEGLDFGEGLNFAYVSLNLADQKLFLNNCTQSLLVQNLLSF